LPVLYVFMARARLSARMLVASSKTMSHFRIFGVVNLLWTK
jgi:hypothetical protein